MSKQTYSPIVDLRMYTHQPNRRDDFIKLFEEKFIETQEAVGIQVIGQFYDLDDRSRCIWMRGFSDMPARKESLTAFYNGPVWTDYRNATNATLIDSGNVLLLRSVHPASGFSLQGNRPPLGARAKQDGFVGATIYFFDGPVGTGFISYFENTMKPLLIETGASILAYFMTEDSPNTYPRLPVREGENAFVWFAGFPDQDAYKSHLTKLRESTLWNTEITQFLKKELQGKPEVLRLMPTPRSWLTGNV